VSRTTTWMLAELLSFRTSVICPNASAVMVITYSPRRSPISHSAVTSISSPGHDGGIDHPLFPFDVGAAYPDPRGGLVGKGVPVVVEDGGQLGNTWDDLGVFICRAPMGVAYFDQTTTRSGS
jgi:hypothetical protein